VSVTSAFSSHALLVLKRRVPVKESPLGRGAVSAEVAAPKLCRVESAQAAADVGENNSWGPPPEELPPDVAPRGDLIVAEGDMTRCCCAGVAEGAGA
jgi:hypothetical protein